MPYDGNGNYTQPAGTAAVSGTVVDSSKFNTLVSDIAAALSGLLKRDGQSAMQADLPMGGKKLTGLANAVADTDGVNLAQLKAIKSIPVGSSSLTPGEMTVLPAGVTLNTGAAAGTTFPLYNSLNSVITITQGSGLTLRLAGVGTTGNRSLGPYGLCTVWCLSPTEYIIGGAGVY